MEKVRCPNPECKKSDVGPKGKSENGKKRYKCKSCGRRFTPDGAKKVVKPEAKRLAVLLRAAAGKKKSFKKIGDLFGVSKQAVEKWWKNARPSSKKSVEFLELNQKVIRAMIERVILQHKGGAAWEDNDDKERKPYKYARDLVAIILQKNLGLGKVEQPKPGEAPRWKVLYYSLPNKIRTYGGKWILLTSNPTGKKLEIVLLKDLRGTGYASDRKKKKILAHNLDGARKNPAIVDWVSEYTSGEKEEELPKTKNVGDDFEFEIE